MPVDAASIRASLSLDDASFQQGMKEARQSLLGFQSASKEAALSERELTRVMEAHTTTGKRLSEVQKQQRSFVAELTAERTRLALQMAGESKITQDLGAKYNLLTNEQRATLQATLAATAAWTADQKALAAEEKAAAKAAAEVAKLTDTEKQQAQLAQQLASEKAKLTAKMDGESKQAQQLAGKYNLLTSEQRAELVATQEQSAALDKQQGSQGGLLAGLGKLYVAHMLLRFAVKELSDGFKFLLESGTQSIDALNKIRVTTGAMGAEFEGMRVAMEHVNKTVPNDLQEVAQAVATVHQRTGATGPALEKLSTQMLNLSRITKGDLNESLRLSTRTFADWGIAARNQGPALDLLFKASQRTGIGMDTLQGLIVRYGAPLREMGFSFTTAAALIANFDKEGVNSQQVLASLRIALARMSKEGVTDAAQGLKQLIEQIKGAGSESQAQTIAIQAFGAKAGPDMAVAIREGRFEVEKLAASLKDSQNAIQKAADAVDPLSKSFDELKKAAHEALAPLGIQLAGALKDFTVYLKNEATPALARFAHFIQTVRENNAKADQVAAASQRRLIASLMNNPVTNYIRRREREDTPAPPITERSAGDAAEFAVDFGQQKVRRENQAFAETWNELNRPPHPASGKKQPDIDPATASAIKSVTDQIKGYRAELDLAGVAATRHRDSLLHLNAEQRAFLVQNREAPISLRLTALALKEQNDELKKHEDAVTTARKAQEAANKSAREEIAALDAQTRQLRATGKVRGELTLLEKHAAAAPELKEALKAAQEREQAAQKEANGLQRVHDVLVRVRAARDALEAAISAGKNKGKAQTIEQEFPGLSPEIIRTREEVQQDRAIRAAQAAAEKDAAAAAAKLERDAAALRAKKESSIASLTQKLADLNAKELELYHTDELDQTSLRLTGKLYRDLQASTDDLDTSIRDLVDDIYNEEQRINRISAASKAWNDAQNAQGQAADDLAGKLKQAQIEHLKLSGATKENILDTLGLSANLDLLDDDVWANVRALEELYKANRKLAESNKFVEQFAQGFHGVMSHVFEDLGQHGFKNFFKNVVDGFKQMLVQIAAEYLASQLTRKLFGDPNESGKRSGGLLGGLMGIFGQVAGAATGGGGGGDSVVGSLAGFGGSALTAADTAGIASVSRNRGMATAPATVQHVTNVHMTVHATDAGSFRRNQDQIHADLFKAAARYVRRGGG